MVGWGTARNKGYLSEDKHCSGAFSSLELGGLTVAEEGGGVAPSEALTAAGSVSSLNLSSLLGRISLYWNLRVAQTNSVLWLGISSSP